MKDFTKYRQRNEPDNGTKHSKELLLSTILKLSKIGVLVCRVDRKSVDSLEITDLYCMKEAMDWHYMCLINLHAACSDGVLVFQKNGLSRVLCGSYKCAPTRRH